MEESAYTIPPIVASELKAHPTTTAGHSCRVETWERRARTAAPVATRLKRAKIGFVRFGRVLLRVPRSRSTTTSCTTTIVSSECFLMSVCWRKSSSSRQQQCEMLAAQARYQLYVRTYVQYELRAPQSLSRASRRYYCAYRRAGNSRRHAIITRVTASPHNIYITPSHA